MTKFDTFLLLLTLLVVVLVIYAVVEALRRPREARPAAARRLLVTGDLAGVYSPFLQWDFDRELAAISNMAFDFQYGPPALPFMEEMKKSMDAFGTSAVEATTAMMKLRQAWDKH